MSTKSFIKIGIALGLLALILAFLGVNYVPRSSASTSTKANVVASIKYARSDYFERHPVGITNFYSGSDWIERHPAAVIASSSYDNSDWFERHPQAQSLKLNLAGSDYIERHPSDYYDNSDWLLRHSGQVIPE
jgi:hypothetical protein